MYATISDALGYFRAISSSICNAIVFFLFLFYFLVYFLFYFYCFTGQWLVLWPHCPVHNCLLTTVLCCTCLLWQIKIDWLMYLCSSLLKYSSDHNRFAEDVEKLAWWTPCTHVAGCDSSLLLGSWSDGHHAGRMFSCTVWSRCQGCC